MNPAVDRDPDGPHAAAVAAQVQPWIDGEITSGVVIALYDAGKREIYGFGKGPGGTKPNGHTLFEIGSVTKVFTSLMLADAVQRREVSLDTAVADLLPPGVTMPTIDKKVITLKHLALHSSGLPRLPPSLIAKASTPDPYAGYGEDQLYADLVHTRLEAAPGEQISYSNYGVGLLGFALGRRLGGGFPAALKERVLDPLKLDDTFLVVPADQQARRAIGTNTELAPVPVWTWDALAGAGALVSTAHDQLALIDDELDAASGGKVALRGAMRFTQEDQLENGQGPNEGLGWQIDAAGRYWHNGGTGGFRSFIGFDPKTRRGVVVLASTATSLVDHLAETMWKVLDGSAPTPAVLPTAEQLAAFAGHYDFAGMKLTVETSGKRVFLLGPGAPKVRMVPVSDHEFWCEELQTAAAFEREGDKVVRVVFVLGDRQMPAAKVD